MKELWEKSDERDKNKKEKRKGKRGGKLNSYLCIKFSKLLWENIHSVIKRTQKEHDLKWPWVRMSYHKFPNLGEIPQGDLVGNIKKGIGSKDFPNHECDCNYTTKVKVTCNYGGECRACIINIYLYIIYISNRG